MPEPAPADLARQGLVRVSDDEPGIHPAVLDLAPLDAPDRIARLARLRPAGPTALRAAERRLLGFLAP